MTAVLPPESPVEAVDPPAFYDALICAAETVLAGEAGEPGKQETSLFEARFAASGAFPVGSREAEALGIILEAAGRVTEEAAP